MLTRLQRIEAEAQQAMDLIAKETMAGVSEWSAETGMDYARADAALRLIARRAGVKYQTDDAYKRMCEDCGWPLPLQRDEEQSSDHAEWCDEYKET